MLGREAFVTEDAGHFAIDVEDRRSGILEQAFRGEMRFAHLLQQLAHRLRPRARRSLVGHARHPLDQVVPEQARQRHRHQAYCAIAADVVLHTALERSVDHRTIDRVEDDDCVLLHA